LQATFHRHRLSCEIQTTHLHSDMSETMDFFVRYKSFVNVIRNPALVTDATFRLFQSKNHDVRTVKMNKVCLSAFDDKRYILNDGVSILAYGHQDIKN